MLQVHRTPRILRTPDLSQPQTAFPTYAPAPPEQVLKSRSPASSNVLCLGALGVLWTRCLAIGNERRRRQLSISWNESGARCVLQGGVHEFLAARLHNVFGQNLDMSSLVQRSRAAVLDTVEASQRLGTCVSLPV